MYRFYSIFLAVTKKLNKKLSNDIKNRINKKLILMELTIIFASTLDHCIGAFYHTENDTKEQHTLPHVPMDKKIFQVLTQHTPDGKPNLLIVGSKTWETLPPVMKKCEFRRYLVLSTKLVPKGNEVVCSNLQDALSYCHINYTKYHKIFVIGGTNVYQQLIGTHFVTEVYHTSFAMPIMDKISGFENKINFVSFDPALDVMFKLISEKEYSDTLKWNIPEIKFNICENIKIIVRHYARPKSFEMQYISLLDTIIGTGNKNIISRNQSETLSVKDVQIKIDLNMGFPILTTRKTYFKGIVEELLWFMRGETDVTILQQRGVKIWDANSTREFLDKNNHPDLKENDIGPSYGFQFRHSGAKYIDCKTEYQGYDQLKKCVELIKRDSTNRRILINLWSVAEIDQMALPPCAFMYQFTVDNNKLNCHLYQRSWDIMLGWNTSTAALLTHLLAHFCDLGVGTLTHTICDAHIYTKHLDAVQELLHNLPYSPPTLKIIGDKPKEIDQYSFKNIKLVDYKSHNPIKMEMIA